MTAPRVSVVVPVFNKAAFLRASLDSIVAAARRLEGGIELFFVDHMSTDGSYEVAEEYRDAATVLRVSGGHPGTVRNHGARRARGEYLSFLDCDCVVPEDYFRRLVAVFEETGAAAVGCEVGIPADAPTIERVWYELHVVRRDGPRHYINSGNFALRRAVFEEIGGFDESLPSGEDTDICRRVRDAGHAIYESWRLDVVHLDNPKRLWPFARKQYWHGLGALGTAHVARNKATAMVLAHALLLVAAVAAAVAPGARGPLGRVSGVVAALLVVPLAAVGYRALETRRVVNPPVALGLYVVYFAARSAALAAALWRRRAPSVAGRLRAALPDGEGARSRRSV